MLLHIGVCEVSATVVFVSVQGNTLFTGVGADKLYPDKTSSLLDGFSCQTRGNNRQSKAPKSTLLMQAVVYE